MVRGNGDGWGDSRVSQRDRIKPSRGEGMATRKAPQRQPRAFEDAESNQRDIRILRAGGQIEALRRAEGMKHRRKNRRVQAIDAADGEAGLGVWHRVRRQEAACRSASASPRRSGWRGRHWPLPAPAWRTEDR